MASLGRIPQPGDTVEFGGMTFEVEEVEGLAVKTLAVSLPAKE
jgi:CBS domain containing-hemolysin-like protein